MGRLRLEPREATLLTEAEYQHYYGILERARKAAMGHHVYWDLEAAEKPAEIRRRFLYVAADAGIPVTVRKARGSHSLTLSFKEIKPPTTRISAGECRKRIIGALSSADKPLQKSEIIRHTGISPSTWNLRINELVESGRVRRIGDRRDTRYSLAG